MMGPHSVIDHVYVVQNPTNQDKPLFDHVTKSGYFIQYECKGG